MDVAIRGDRASCLTFQLSKQTWLFAVAQGFGRIDGVPSAPATLARLRGECERRLRNERFRRAIDRPQAAATALLGVLARVNGDLFVRSAAHDDYVTAGCSVSAALIVHGRAYVLHAGGTAAYLAHRGQVSALTSDDGFDGAAGSLLARALGTSAALDVAVSSVPIEPGDVMILVGHRVRGEIDRDALIAHVEDAGPSEHLLVIRFDDEDHRDLETRLLGDGAVRPRNRVRAWVIGTLAFLASYFVVNGFGH
jgi:serine/threonine protein phosphatase PrpC